MNAPAGLSALPENVIYPADNTYNAAKEELGRLLFWDPILSGNKDIACVSCHHPSLAFADGIQLSKGVGGTGLGMNRTGGQQVKRNSQTVLNTAFNGLTDGGEQIPEAAPMFWDSREFGLEGQAQGPILSAEEMRGTAISEEDIIDTVLSRLNSIPEYKNRFLQSFGSNQITEIEVLQAIATYERSLTANNSPFDQYMRGNTTALSGQEIRGMNVFENIGCVNCHSGPMLSDFEFHVIGVPDHPLQEDNGANNQHQFRTPSLRNIELTGPYMHNGTFANLRDVVEFYQDLGRGDADIHDDLNNDELAEEVRDIRLNNNAIDDIIAFMECLTDDSFDKSIPMSVPSGLSVGGNIN